MRKRDKTTNDGAAPQTGAGTVTIEADSVEEAMSRLATEVGDSAEIVDARADHALQSTELAQQLATLLGAEPGDFLQPGRVARFRTPLSMPGDRKAMCLVTNLLHEQQRWRIRRQL